MTKPVRSVGSEFSKREIVLLVLVMILLTALTIWGTFYVLKTFVIGSPNDPLARAGSISSSQQRALRAK
jgi:hypothetical protein